jgi:hypothetical protein
MKRILINMVLGLTAFSLISSCNNNIQPIPYPPDQEYPSVLLPISPARVDSIQNAICSNDFYSYIDEYGLFSFSRTLNRGYSNITDKNIAIRLAKEALLKYSNYSNVNDTTQLELGEVIHYNSSPFHFTDWIISFKNQKYQGIEVLNTGIMVIVKDQVSQIIGHHFKDISLPSRGIKPKEESVELLIGTKLDAMCWTRIEITITPEMVLRNKIAENILWRKVDNNIEFRVTWYIPLTDSNDDNISWNVWLDILSGEILLYNSTVIC